MEGNETTQRFTDATPPKKQRAKARRAPKLKDYLAEKNAWLETTAEMDAMVGVVKESRLLYSAASGVGGAVVGFVIGVLL